MPRKGKRRREAQRTRRQRIEPQEQGSAEDVAQRPPAPQPRREQRRPPPRRGGGGFRVPAAAIWALGLLVVAGGIGALIVIIASGGSSEGTVSTPAKTAPSLLNGKPPDVTLTVDATDQGQATNPLFTPATLTAKAGQVVRIVLHNKGSVAHNLHVAGLNNQYDDVDVPGTDDWITTPPSVEAGQDGSLLLKIDKPGVYAFHCDFHVDQQRGTLTLQ